MSPDHSNQDSISSWPPALIGRRVRYQGQTYEIIEILIEEPALLVLQNEGHTTIQPDQHGEAHRRVPETVTLPVTLKNSGDFDFEDMEVELLDGRAEAVD